jgi:hypothetical protein
MLQNNINDYIIYYEKIELLKEILSIAQSSNMKYFIGLQITKYMELMDEIEKSLELIEIY